MESESGDDRGITRDWHGPSSHDLSPIEHLWHMIEVRIRERRVRPRTKVELWAAVFEEHNAIPQLEWDARIIDMFSSQGSVLARKRRSRGC